MLGQDIWKGVRVPGHPHRQQAELKPTRRLCCTKRMSRLCFQRKLGSLSVCRKWWRFTFNQLWRVQCTFLWSAGGAASETETPTDWLNRSGTLALWLVANQTQLWKLWWRGGHTTHYYPSRIIPTTFCTARRTCCGAPSLTRRFRKPFIHLRTLCNETHLLSNINILFQHNTLTTHTHRLHCTITLLFWATATFAVFSELFLLCWLWKMHFYLIYFN